MNEGLFCAAMVYKVSWPIIYGQSFGQQLYCIWVFDLFLLLLPLVITMTLSIKLRSKRLVIYLTETCSLIPFNNKYNIACSKATLSIGHSSILWNFLQRNSIDKMEYSLRLNKQFEWTSSFQMKDMFPYFTYFVYRN